jgi:hypothetical protein
LTITFSFHQYSLNEKIIWVAITAFLLTGQRYWLLNGNRVVADFPKSGRPLVDMGFYPDIEKVDAAFIWSHNLKTYFITGDMYWRYDEKANKMKEDYPRPMKMWRGVPLPVDTAFQSWDRKDTSLFTQQTNYALFFLLKGGPISFMEVSIGNSTMP